MTTTTQLIAFLFAYVPRRPRSTADARKNASLVQQNQRIKRLAAEAGREIRQRFVATSVNRRKPFILSDGFLKAVATAKSTNSDLVLADIVELLGRTAEDRILECVAALNALDVLVWDASLRAEWHSLPGGKREELTMQAVHARISRSGAIKAGLKLGGKRRTDSPVNRTKGSAANVAMANRRALRLRAFVEAEIAKLADGQELSPSGLARSLNAEGIPAARGGTWTHNAAKNLITRLTQFD